MLALVGVASPSVNARDTVARAWLAGHAATNSAAAAAAEAATTGARAGDRSGAAAVVEFGLRLRLEMTRMALAPPPPSILRRHARALRRPREFASPPPEGKGGGERCGSQPAPSSPRQQQCRGGQRRYDRRLGNSRDDGWRRRQVGRDRKSVV